MVEPADPRPSSRSPVMRSAGCGCLPLLAIVGLAWVVAQWVTWPDVPALATNNPESTAFIDRYQTRATGNDELPALDWRWVPYDQITANLKGAVLVAEDIEFFSHNGFSTSEIEAAVREAWEEREAPRGASTITQQLAKNLWLSPSRNPLRKLKEGVLTGHLEKHLTKHRILEVYLNVVEFGSGIYGAEAASQRYFDKPASRLTRREAAMLAASLPRPSTWHPGSESSAYAARVDRVEGLMRQHSGFLRRRFLR